MLAVTLATSPAALAPPDSLCTVEDRRLVELSGMVVDRGGLWAMADSGRRVELHRLDTRDCSVTDTRTAAIDPFDAEDLARGPDGALWVADTGDNERRRATVAVIVVPARGAARLHRLTYPDGPHDAEALLVDAAGVPFVITKEVGRPAGIYRTEGSLAGPRVDTEGSLAGPRVDTEGSPDGRGQDRTAGSAIPLVRVGEVTLPVSDTPGGPIGGLGSRVVTGAATSANGRVVALRSYTDAWLYPMVGDDILAALAEWPVHVPLPDEPQGEAIAFEPDGTLLSGSEGRGPDAGMVRAVSGAAALAEGADGAAPTEAPRAGPAGAPAGDDGPVWVTAVIAGVVLVLLGIAALSLRTSRRH